MERPDPQLAVCSQLVCRDQSDAIALRKISRQAGIRDVALDGVELRVPSSTNFSAKARPIPAEPPGDEDGAIREIHTIPFISTIHGNAFYFLRADFSAPHEPFSISYAV
jgi:hypothetical protein